MILAQVTKLGFLLSYYKNSKTCTEETMVKHLLRDGRKSRPGFGMTFTKAQMAKYIEVYELVKSYPMLGTIVCDRDDFFKVVKKIKVGLEEKSVLYNDWV